MASLIVVTGRGFCAIREPSVQVSGQAWKGPNRHARLCKSEPNGSSNGLLGFSVNLIKHIYIYNIYIRFGLLDLSIQSTTKKKIASSVGNEPFAFNVRRVTDREELQTTIQAYN